MTRSTASSTNRSNPSSATRRAALAAGGAGLVGFIGLPESAVSADMTAAEKTNVQIVSDFCASWPAHDLDRVMAFFAENCAYRVTETQEPNKGRQAVTDRIRGFLDRVERFEVIESLAKGPMVFNERKDFFTSGPLKMWHGVGVFFLKEGKIVEWYDYTISAERA
jgi:limonene-1,2-epoxide hydrolase